MEDVTVLTPSDAQPGFALAGVRQITVQEGEFLELVEEQFGSNPSGLLIVDERLVPEDLAEPFQDILRHAGGFAVILPAPRAVRPLPAGLYAPGLSIGILPAWRPSGVAPARSQPGDVAVAQHPAEPHQGFSCLGL